MKRNQTILVILVLALAQAVFAQKSNLHIPAGKPGAQTSEAGTNKHQEQLERALFRGRPFDAHKSTLNGQRLAGAAFYSYIPTPLIVDSSRFTYSGARGSEFDFYFLNYDIRNYNDLPSAYDISITNVNYDSSWYYDPTGATSPQLISVRSYTSAGKVARDEKIESELSTFLYNGNNQRIQANISTYDVATMSWENGRRYFYTYDGSGYLIRDSAENWNGSGWTPDYTDVYVNNASGMRVHVEVLSYTLGVPTLETTYDLSYPAAVNVPNRILTKWRNSYTQVLENQSLDTLVHVNGVPVLWDTYQWDSASAAWTILVRERRRMNANLLPDSAWEYFYYGSPPDTESTALGYDARNNPVWTRKYYGAQPSTFTESRWYYEAIPGTGLPTMSVTLLEFYPNPVREDLYISNLSEGEYSLFNVLGQKVQSGTYQKGVSIPMKYLPPGQYLLRVESSSRELFSGTVIKE